MVRKNPLDLYKAHFVDKDFERFDLFQLVRERFAIRSAIYPGSFVHVTPSFVFPCVTYIEMDTVLQNSSPSLAWTTLHPEKITRNRYKLSYLPRITAKNSRGRMESMTC